MKRIIPIVLILVLLLSACAKIPDAYTVTANGVQLTVNLKDRRISDGTNTYFYTRTGIGTQNQMNYSTSIYYPDGSTWELEEKTANGSSAYSHVTTSDDYDASRYLPGETLMEAITLASEQKAALDAKTIKVDWYSFILGSLCLIWGVLGLLFPETMWELGVMFRRWRYRDLDPTEEGLFSQRVGNSILAVIGVIFLLIAFLQ